MASAFTIEVRVGPPDAAGAYPVEAALGDGGTFVGGRLAVDRAALRGAEFDAGSYGRILTDALFAGPIGQAYDLAAARAEALTGGRLRVRLRIDPGAAELHALAWERLRHRFRGRDIPLATSSLTPFSRYVGLQTAEVAPLAERPVRLLVAVANPAEAPASLAPVDVAGEIALLAEALGDLGGDGPLRVTVLPGRARLPEEQRAALAGRGYAVANGPTSLDVLRRLLLGHHVLHLVAHGSYRGGETALHLEDDAGGWQLTPDRVFVPALAAAGVLPHAIVLVACDGARRDEGVADPFVGVGPKLVEAGVPAVVAMRERITMRSAQQLAGDFYRRLLEHGEVDRALNEARLLLVDDRRDWSAPVLFSRLPDGQLFAPDRATAAPAATGTGADPIGARPVDHASVEPGSIQLKRDLPSGPLSGTSRRDSGGSWDRMHTVLKVGWSRVPGIFKALTAFVTAVAGLLTALAAAGIFPFDSGAGGGSSPLSGTLSDVVIADRSLSLGDFCDRRSLPCDSVDEDERRRPGNVFGYTVETEGYEGQRLPIKWSMYDAATQQRVTEPTLIYQDGWPDGVYTPAAARDRNSGELWIPLPPTSGEYFVRLELFPPDGARLDWEDSVPFDI